MESIMNVIRIIKKYPNRRLYDTFTKCYITLAEVKQLVLSNIEIQVVDVKTNEDLTNQVLLQIIMDEENRQIPFFTRNILQNIIRIYGHSTQELMQQYFEKMMAWLSDPEHNMQENLKNIKNPFSMMQEFSEYNLNLWQSLFNQKNPPKSQGDKPKRNKPPSRKS